MRKRNVGLPPELQDDDSSDNSMDAEEAMAKIADLFTNPKYAKVMAILKSEEDAQKVWMMYSMGKRRPFRFLVDMANDKLLLSRSVKGLGSVQAIKALEACSGGGAGEEKLGLTDRIKGFFKRDFVDSGGGGK